MLITGVDIPKGVKNLTDSSHHLLQIDFVIKMCKYVQTMLIGLRNSFDIWINFKVQITMYGG